MQLCVNIKKRPQVHVSIGRAVKNLQCVHFPDNPKLRNNFSINKFVIVSDIPRTLIPKKSAVFEKYIFWAKITTVMGKGAIELKT